MREKGQLRAYINHSCSLAFLFLCLSPYPLHSYPSPGNNSHNGPPPAYPHPYGGAMPGQPAFSTTPGSDGRAAHPVPSGNVNFGFHRGGGHGTNAPYPGSHAVGAAGPTAFHHGAAPAGGSGYHAGGGYPGPPPSGSGYPGAPPRGGGYPGGPPPSGGGYPGAPSGGAGYGPSSSGGYGGNVPFSGSHGAPGYTFNSQPGDSGHLYPPAANLRPGSHSPAPSATGMLAPGYAAGAVPEAPQDEPCLQLAPPFPCYLPMRMRVHVASGMAAKLIGIATSWNERDVVLTSKAVLIYFPRQDEPESQFELLPRSELRVTLSASNILLVKNLQTKKTLAICAVKDKMAASDGAAPQDVSDWHAALEAAQKWESLDDLPVPSSFPTPFQKSLRNVILTRCSYRYAWQHLLVNPMRVATFKAIETLYTDLNKDGFEDALSAVEDPVDHVPSYAGGEQPAKPLSSGEKFLNFLVALDEHSVLRNVLLAMDVATDVLDEWDNEANEIERQKMERERVQSDFNPFNHGMAWGQELSYASDSFNARSGGQAKESSTSFTKFYKEVEMRIRVAMDNDPRWSQSVLPLLGYTGAADAEESFHKTAQKISIAKASDLARLGNTHTLRCFIYKQWVARLPPPDAVQRMLADIARLSPEEAATIAPNPAYHEAASGTAYPEQPKESLLLPLLHFSKRRDQMSVLVALVARGAFHTATFSNFVDGCVDLQRQSLLALVCRELIPQHASGNAQAPLVLFKAAAAAAGDSQKTNGMLLVEFGCQLVGSSPLLAAKLAKWQVNAEHPELISKLKRHLAAYAQERLCDLVNTNKCWYTDDFLAQNALRDRCHRNRTLDEDTDGVSRERLRDELSALLSGTVQTCLRLGQNEVMLQWGRKMSMETFRLCFAQASLRETTIATLGQLRPSIFSEVYQLVVAGRLLGRPEFFLDSTLRALDRSTAMCYDFLQSTYFQLLEAADRLDEYSSFDLSRLKRRSLTFKAGVIRGIISRICKAIIDQVQPEQKVDFTIDDLLQCALDSSDALAILTDARGLTLLEGCLQHYLHNCAPSAWTSLFHKLDTIAFFIKYLLRESYERAWTAFEAANTNATWVTGLLDDARAQFKGPLVPSHQLRLDSAEAQEEIISDIEAKSKSADATDDMKFIFRFTAAWMRHMQGISGIPMLPHNTQVITTLLFASFYKLRQRKAKPDAESASRFSTLFAEVGTGEGKSVIIVMMALYFVTVHGRRVHVLENNISLRDRDHANYKNFYAGFTKTTGQAVTVSKNPASDDADIVYCLKDDLTTMHKSMASEGTNPFKELVLIADEVDDLVIDKNPTTRYVIGDSGRSQYILACYRALQAKGPLLAEKPVHCPGSVWTDATQAVSEASTWREGKHYLFDGSKFCIVDS